MTPTEEGTFATPLISGRLFAGLLLGPALGALIYATGYAIFVASYEIFLLFFSGALVYGYMITVAIFGPGFLALRWKGWDSFGAIVVLGIVAGFALNWLFISPGGAFSAFWLLIMGIVPATIMALAIRLIAGRRA